MIFWHFLLWFSVVPFSFSIVDIAFTLARGLFGRIDELFYLRYLVGVAFLIVSCSLGSLAWLMLLVDA